MFETLISEALAAFASVFSNKPAKSSAGLILILSGHYQVIIINEFYQQKYHWLFKTYIVLLPVFCTDPQLLWGVYLFVCRLVGCQGLLEEIPGRRKDSLQLLISSPGESKSLLRKKESKKSYNVKEEMSSK